METCYNHREQDHRMELSNNGVLIMKATTSGESFYKLKIHFYIDELNGPTVNEKHKVSSSNADVVVYKGMRILHDVLGDLIPDTDIIEVNEAYKNMVYTVYQHAKEENDL